jgi:hypothetical protein
MASSRRDFLQSAGATLGALTIPSWVFEAEAAVDAKLAADKNRLADVALGVAKKLGASYADIRINREGFLRIPNARLWSPADPFLYDLKAELIHVKNPWPKLAGAERPNERRLRFGAMERELYAKAEADGAPLETITSYFGMRKLSLGAGTVAGQPALLLNGQPLFQHGPLDQGWWPEGLHTPPSDEAMKWEIEWLRSAGFNMLRKHIKVEPARYYYPLRPPGNAGLARHAIRL